MRTNRALCRSQQDEERLRCSLGVRKDSHENLASVVFVATRHLHERHRCGVFLGFASLGFKGFKTLPLASGYVAVFTFALMNLLFLVVAPRIHAKKTAAIATPSAWRVLYDVLAERPFITMLLILQLVRVSQSTGATFIFFQGPTGQYFQSVPNVQPYVYLTGWFMTGIAILWLLSAVGIWRSHWWAWWLALVLNGLSVVSQLLNLHKVIPDPLSAIAVVLLLLPRVRAQFRRDNAAVEHATSR